jgi:sporulation protein YlmC with PRC-barrel domain
LVNVDELNGKNAISAGGIKIGEVVNAKVDTNTWQINHLHVKLSTIASETLDFKKPLPSSTLGMPAFQVSAVGDAVTIKNDIKRSAKTAQLPNANKKQQVSPKAVRR